MCIGVCVPVHVDVPVSVRVCVKLCVMIFDYIHRLMSKQIVTRGLHPGTDGNKCRDSQPNIR